MGKYDRMDGISRQVAICFDGDEQGQVIQTDIATFESYYRPLGWTLIGQAQPLPVISDIKPLNRQGNLI
jgi:hypothetical protein